ncbi:chromosome condensation complex protein [Moniliophthora roreri MCA 2997]|uniref:Condensin complex subunit 1 n=1 Tax=Moniliophthora roreri (strain MCA 2997) TaxID=1381753 RepID=V2WNU5_MONRO|nr:chromosome condensation complex protein [Moniliophthora roreri MCA 2997]
MDTNFDFSEALEKLGNIEDFDLEHERDLNEEDADIVLEGAVEAVAESSDAITKPEVFAAYCSLLKHVDSVAGGLMSKLLDSISSGLQSEFEATLSDVTNDNRQTFDYHRKALEMYALLLQWFTSVAEKVKSGESDEAISAAPAPKRRGRGGKAGGSGRGTGRSTKKQQQDWNWVDQIPLTLLMVSRVLKRLPSQRLWTTSAEREKFISCITRPAYHVAESEQYMKSNDIRQAFYMVICHAIKHHGHAPAAQILFMQRLQYYEHLAEPLADCIEVLAKQFDHHQLGDEIIREISQKTFSGQDNKTPKAFAAFLVKLSGALPRVMLKQISLLLGLLDSEANQIRNAIVDIIGDLIRDLDFSLDQEASDDGAMDAKQIQKQIKGLYDLLLERMLDTSPYVRAKVLHVLHKLCRIRRKFPKQRLAATRAAVVALEDKATRVRAAAIALLVELMRTHPYGFEHGGVLTLSTFVAAYEAVKAELEKVEALVGKAMEAPQDQGDDEQDVREKRKKKRPKKKKQAKLKPRKSQLNVSALDAEAAIAQLEGRKMEQLRLQKKYYSEATNFIRLYEEDAMKKMEELLGSSTKTDVLEAMEFFKVANEYQMTSSDQGLRAMLHLIWRKDNSTTSEDGKELKGIRSRLLECYRTIYFDPIEGLDPQAQVNRIAKNMIELTYDATLAELTSLEEMMRTMMDDGQIHQDIINKLWQIFGKDRALPKPQRRGAIIILGMLALAKRNVLADRVETMLKVGLGALGKTDLTLARYTCVALQRLNGSAKKVKGSLVDKNVRLEMGDQVFEKLQHTIERPCRSKEWFGLAEQVINTIYALGDHPDVLCNTIIKNLSRRAFSPRTKSPADSAPGGDDPEVMDQDYPGDISQVSASDVLPSQNETQDGQQKHLGDAFELSQLLFVVGHVAIKHIAYLELVEREWKRQKDEKQAAEKAARGGTQQASKDGEELDQVAGSAEDEIGERVQEIREQEMLFGPESLLAVYGSMLVHICGSPQKFKNPTLRAAATLSLSKFLCVSSTFCDNHHRLLFKILEISKNASIRSNIVIALGDVAVAFSSIIDENSNELYKGLTDKDPTVKKNTLMVLTHLILNGMIKVKGQLGEMAKCLEDEDQRIVDLAKLFFSELSTKDNAIYNNLPDIISHLSTGEHAVSEETFQNTMKYIFKFIEKDKQAENIIEKLCQRFRLTDDERQWRDIAYCLSLLQYKSEKSIKKLVDNLQLYQDKLHVPGLHERFSEILSKARQQKFIGKENVTSELQEFEKILDEQRQRGEDDLALEKRVQEKKAARQKRAKRNAKRKVAAKADEDDE